MKSWNFWTPVQGTLYGIRAYHPDDYMLQLQGLSVTPRVIYAYGGKTWRRWESRMNEHLWGGGQYNATPQPFADTVLGWRQDGTLDEVIAAGGVYPIWQGWTVPLLLSVGEVFYAIRIKRPYYNYQWNLGNSRRIPIPKAEDQRELRDVMRRGTGSGVKPRTRNQHGSRARTGSVTHFAQMHFPTARHAAGVFHRAAYYRRVVFRLLLLAALVMFIPGMPAADAFGATLRWISAHREELILGGVLLVALMIGRPALKGTRRRKRRKSRRRRSRSRR